MMKLAALGIALVLVLAQSATAEHLSAKVAAPRLPVHLETNKSGLLAELHELLMAEADVQSTLQVSSYARAVLKLESAQVDAYFPSWLPNHFKVDVLYSAPLMRVEFYIFTAQGKPRVSRLDELAHMRLGTVEGTLLELPLDSVPGLFVVPGVNATSLYNMLNQGRLDALLISKNEMDILCEQLGVPMLNYDPSAMQAHKYLGYSFLNNAKGIKLQRQINAAILRLQQSGELARRFPTIAGYLQ